MNEKKVTRIPPKFTPLKKTKVAIYCRVSTNHPAQLESLSAQVDYFKNMVETTWSWELAGVYADVCSGKNNIRSELQRMIMDCHENRINLVMVKSISRLGRNTVEVLKLIRQLRSLDVDIHFDTENINISDRTNDVMISVIEAIAQAESESRSQNIKMGIVNQLSGGTSKLYDKPCYGYRTNAIGKLVIDKKQKSVVQKIFELYLIGYSILGIIRYLEEKKIASPSVKPKWSKRSVELLLSNEKYIGNVIVGKTYCDEYPNNQRRINNGEHKKYLMKDSHEPIITTEQFEAVQEEKLRRSNIQISDSSVSRKKTHYSMKNIERVE